MSNTPDFIIENKDQPEHRLELSLNDEPDKKLLKVIIKGRLDIFTYREMYKRLDEVLGSRAELNLLADLSQVSFVASSGWFVFVTLRARLKRLGGTLSFVGMGAELARVYKAMKLDELIPAYENMESALQGLGKA